MHSGSAGNGQGTNKKKKNQCYICRYSHNCKMHANSSFAIHFNISVFQIKYFNDNLDILFLLRNQHLSILPGSMLCIHILAKNCNVNTFLLCVSLQKYKIRYPLGWRRSQSTIHLMLHFIILHFFFPKLICWAILVQNGNAVNYPTSILQIMEQIITHCNWVLICYSTRRQL